MSSLRDWGARLCQGVEICQWSSNESKNHDELINYTVRVSVVVLALTTQMILRHKAFSKSVAVKVQEMSMLYFY